MDKDADNRETWGINLQLFWEEFNPPMIILDPFDKVTRHQVPWEKETKNGFPIFAAFLPQRSTI